MKSAREIFHQGKFTNVKITSGLFRGRELKAPQNGVTHPMGSREKLALFNSLGDKIKDKIILDVFAGTGALGLEALSRGASHVTFIEADKKAAEILKQNAIVLGVFKQVRIYNTKAEKIDFDSPFDIVIADPPYEYFHDLSLSVLDRLEDGIEVTPETLVVAGIIKNTRDGVKLLGNGSLTKKFNIKYIAVSESAKAKIEAAGGTCEVI